MKRTTTEAELRQWAREGKSQREIAELLGRNKICVANACVLLGIKTHGFAGGIRRIDTNQCVDLLRQGFPLREVAEKCGATITGVHRALVRDGLPTSARKLLRAESAQANQA